MSLWLAAALPLLADDVTVNVEANRNQLYLGESFILQVNVSGTGEADPDLSGITNCKVRGLGRQNVSNYSISFVNGQMTRQGFSGLVISYEITPLAAGEFRAGPVAVTAGGRRLTAEGPTLVITDIEKQNLVKLAITSSSETVLIDEPFEVTLTVQIKRLAGRFTDAEPLFPNSPPVLTIPWLNPEGTPGLKGPDLNQLLNQLLVPNNQPGFAINDYMRQPELFDFSSLMAGGRRRATFKLDRRLIRLAGAKSGNSRSGAWQNGADYVEYFLTLSYSPVDEGNYVFGPLVFKGSVPLETDDMGKAHGMAVFAVGPACTVRVIPPPEQGRPACFTGAIGKNLAARAELDASICFVGDPLKLTLELTGDVRFDKILPPKLSLQTNLLDHFTVYDNTVQTLRQTNSCRYIYTLRPTHAGAFQVPPIEVAYYDVLSREYKTVATPMIPLAVKLGSEITGSQIIGNTNRLLAAAAKEDDRTRPAAPARADSAGAESVLLLGNPVWIAVAGAGPGLFLAGLLIGFYRKHGEQRRAARRRRQALPRALRHLDKAARLGGKDLPHCREAAGEVCAAIRSYIAARLNVPAHGITPEDARLLLASAGAPDDARGQLCRFFEKYFNLGFSSRTAPAELRADCLKLGGLIREIDGKLRTRGIRKSNKASSLILLLMTAGLALFSVMPATALDKSEHEFIWNEGNALMAAARAPDAYLRAAQTYRKLVDDGVRNGPLFYNLGTALLQAGETDAAIDALQRAEQFLGARVDIRQNLKIALARKADNETAEWPWFRLVLFWHFYFSAAARMMTASIAFLVFWAALTLRLTRIKRSAANALLILAALAVILFGSSAAAAWHQASTPPAGPLTRQSIPG